MSRRIILFTSGNLFQIGGVQRSFVILTDYLVKQGFDVLMVGWADEKKTRADFAYSIHEKIDIYLTKQKFTISELLKTKQVIEEFNPDISVIVNSSQNGLFHLMASKLAGVKVLYSIRGSSEFCLRTLWPCMKSLEVAFLNSDAIHVLMPSYKELYPKYIQEKIRNIPSQIEKSKIDAKVDVKNSEDRYIVLYSGRYSFEKRVDLLLSAFDELKTEFQEWDLWLYGNGPLEENLKNQAKEMGLEDRIVFGTANNTDEMYEVYPKVHLKVLPSEQEGCPMALREAMAHAIPVIGFDECSGTNEIIEDGIDGLLVKSDDHVARLVEGMRVLMNDASLRVKMGLKAKEKANQYEPDYINQQWEKLILDTIHGVGCASPSIREKYKKEHDEAKLILDDLIKKERYRDIYIFERDQELFERYKDEYLMIYGHRLFDKRFYLEEYFEVKKMGVDPLLHYVSEGWKLGYNPSAEFDNDKYIEIYLDGKKTICPLYHFYIDGRFKGNFPIEPETDYFEKWPGRKPKTLYSIEEDCAIELEFLNSINNIKEENDE